VIEPGADPTDVRDRIARGFERFALDAAGRSPLYVEIARTVAATDRVLTFLATMPEPKWQPNVLLAVVRYLCGPPSPRRSRPQHADE